MRLKLFMVTKSDNYLESLLYDSSRAAIDKAFKVVEADTECLGAMLALCARPYPFAMRAARVMQLFFEKYPESIIPFLTFLTDELLKTGVDGVKRSFLKIMIDHVDVAQIPNAGLVFNQCLNWLYSPKEAIAVRAFSLDLAVKFVLKEPDLKNELMLVFENVTFDESPGLEARKIKCMKRLNIQG